MKYLQVVLFSCIILLFSGCSAIETIFKAGMWWAFFLVFIVIFGVGWLFMKARKKK